MSSTTRFDLDSSALAARRRKGRWPRGLRALLAVLMATSLASVVLGMAAPLAVASNSVSTASADVGLVPFTGDVYTVDSEDNLIPVTITSTPLSAPLYNVAGDPLNLTWGQWSSATATSLAKTVTHKATESTAFRIKLAKLIPNGVYSLFYRTFGPDSSNPICPTTEPLVALTARHPQRQKPDPDSFVASSSGTATFHALVPGALLDAAQLQIDVIYHFDGHTYGPVPNAGEANNNCHSSFGIDAMRQFIIIQTNN
jgi:hypothetical protein